MFISIIFLLLFWSLNASSRLCTHETIKHYTVNSSSALSDLFNSTKPPLSCSVINIEGVTLSTTVILMDSFNISFIGKGSTFAEVMCEEDSGLKIIDSQLIHLENLMFVGCSVTDTVASFNYQHTDQAAIYVYNSSDIQITNCFFFDNPATGLILYDVTGTIFINSTIFLNSRPENDTGQSNKTYGGLIIRRESKEGEANYVIETCFFYENTNNQDQLAGGMTVHLGATNSNSSIVVHNSNFSHNTGRSGGGIYLEKTSLSIATMNVTATRFLNNTSKKDGGGIFVRNFPMCGNITINLDFCEFDYNHAYYGGGISSFVPEYNVSEMGSTIFIAHATNWTHNIATVGSAVSLKGNQTKNQLIEFVFKDCWICNNSHAKFADPSAVGAVFVEGAKITIRGDSEISRNYGSALYLRKRAQAAFEEGTAHFNNNEATQGGAIALRSLSTLHLGSNSTLFFMFNSAIEKGGAIYAEVDEYHPCVFDFLRKYNSAPVLPKGSLVTFTENYAYNYKQEQDIYIDGHYPKNCIIDENSTFLRSHPFYYKYEYDSSVLFDPFWVEFSVQPIMLGEKFHLNPTVLDRFGHSTTGTAFITLSYNDTEDDKGIGAFKLVGPSMIGLDEENTKFNALRIQGKDESQPSNKSLRLQVFFKKNTGGYRSGYNETAISLTSCKLGYKFDRVNATGTTANHFGACSCFIHGNHGNMFCLNTSIACVRNGYWFGRTPDGSYNTLICDSSKCNYSNQKCPTNVCANAPDYCELTNDDSAFCTQGRGGVLCSKCQDGYAFTAFSYQCVPNHTCSPRHSVPLILGVLSYWLFMISFFFIFLSLDLSIVTGVASGIAYYFSVVFVLTRGVITDKTLDVFLNAAVAITQLCPYLFGMIPVCLFQGLDHNLPHQLLRLASSLVVVVSILAIVWFFRYCKCPKFLSLAENSPNHAICLLILISYTSMTYNCLEILRPIKINGHLYVYIDPEIPYFHPKHLPYALFALFVELFISLPICILFLFAPWISRLKGVNLVKLRLKPILDEYQACYKKRHRWYAGFYFLGRQLMYFANFVVVPVLPQSNSFVHFVCILVLLVMTTVQPYKKRFWYLNVVDTILLTDVLLLSVLPINSHVSPVSVPGYMHTVQKVTPYVLILLPCLYLFGLITILLLRRFQGICRRFRREKSQYQPAAPISSTTRNGGESEYEKSFEDPFFRDFGEREPLLRESDEDSVTSDSHTGAVPKSRRRGHTTYTSFRVSDLEKSINK